MQLDYLLNYKNEKLITRYKKDHPGANMCAEDALHELIKYIWLCRKHAIDKKNNPHDQQYDFTCAIHEEMIDIDNMWHTFLLFTKEYHAFCHEYLNDEFFHHDPMDESAEQISPHDYEQQLTRYLLYIYNNLGENTVLKWFGNTI